MAVTVKGVWLARRGGINLTFAGLSCADVGEEAGLLAIEDFCLPPLQRAHVKNAGNFTSG